ncbi:hypothetical protein FAM21823_01552 [Lentilactobacillus parabuchneri]|nr:hypothetical protein FAM21823_01552 [Lentilactobacillus parabuchneri]
MKLTKLLLTFLTALIVALCYQEVVRSASSWHPGTPCGVIGSKNQPLVMAAHVTDTITKSKLPSIHSKPLTLVACLICLPILNGDASTTIHMRCMPADLVTATITKSIG